MGGFVLNGGRGYIAECLAHHPDVSALIRGVYGILQKCDRSGVHSASHTTQLFSKWGEMEGLIANPTGGRFDPVLYVVGDLSRECTHL